MMTMRNAIIYVRVSTEEQSEKGYSLAHQEERLRNYCKQHNITVVGFYKEDHSAKTFDRPAFNELLSYLKKNKKDFHSRRGLLKMVAKRRKLMAYLEKTNEKSYKKIVKELGLKG